MSRLTLGSYAMRCCGNFICRGCYKENGEYSGNNAVNECSFCRRKIYGTFEEGTMQQLEGRIDNHNDPSAYNSLGWMTLHGKTKNALKALGYFIRGAELGSKEACVYISNCFSEGRGVSPDTEKALFISLPPTNSVLEMGTPLSKWR